MASLYFKWGRCSLTTREREKKCFGGGGFSWQPLIIAAGTRQMREQGTDRVQRALPKMRAPWTIGAPLDERRRRTGLCA